MNVWRSIIKFKILKFYQKTKTKKMETKLLLALFFCHFLADYTHLSTAWMLIAKRLGKPLLPILAHAMIHSVLMGIVLFIYGVTRETYGILMLLQISSHFLIDVWKGRMNGWFPKLQSPANKWHWIVFGFDQYLHAVIIIIMVNYIC